MASTAFFDVGPTFVNLDIKAGVACRVCSALECCCIGQSESRQLLAGALFAKEQMGVLSLGPRKCPFSFPLKPSKRRFPPKEDTPKWKSIRCYPQTMTIGSTWYVLNMGDKWVCLLLKVPFWRRWISPSKVVLLELPKRDMEETRCLKGTLKV